MEDREPSGGLSLKAALERYGNAKARAAYFAAREAWRAAGAPRYQVHYHSRDKSVSLSQKGHARERNRLIRARDQKFKAWAVSFWAQLGVDLCAWGAQPNPLAPRTRIPDEAFAYLKPRNWEDSVVAGPDGLRIYSVQIHTKSSVEEVKQAGQKVKVYDQVAEAFASLPGEKQRLVLEYGGKVHVTQLICDALPHIGLSSIEREFRRFLKGGGFKSPPKPEK